jgi:hypothetical protein
MNHVKPELGLHGLVTPKSIFQKSFLSAQCVEVCDQLKGLIEATEKVVPPRKANFKLNEDHGKPVPIHLESRLERAIWKAASHDRENVHLGNIFIHSFQIPLNAHARDLTSVQSNAGWRKFDLMGTDQEGVPVVFELKGEANDPVHMIVEAAKYGVAVKKMWPDMLKEWRKVFKRNKFPIQEYPLKRCRLVCAAPQSFWEDWSGYKNQLGLWNNIARLCDGLSENELPVDFATFKYTGTDPTVLPEIVGLKLIILPIQNKN